MRLESRVKSLNFLAEVQAKEMRSLKTKVDRLHSQNEIIQKQVANLMEKDSTSDCSGGCGNCSSLATRDSIEMLQQSVEEIGSSVEKVTSQVIRK